MVKLQHAAGQQQASDLADLGARRLGGLTGVKGLESRAGVEGFRGKTRGR